ncbi:MAG: hypothetical protein O3C27_16150 [Actinomycetota bacterium]|nr:hypothetical protein [Actinomycetota bacterium]
MAIDVRGLGPKISNLKATAPGSVVVPSTTDIGFVQALKAATDQLTDDQRASLAETMDHLKSEFAGLEGMVSGVDKGSLSNKRRLWELLTFRGVARMGSKEEVARAHHNAMLAASGVAPTASPAPRSLLKAAEAWLAADLAEGLPADQRALLKYPWEGCAIVS